jgi:hypothetical protein
LTSFFCILYLFSPITATAQDADKEALFGLTWGITVESLQKQGIKLDKKKADRNLENYECSSLPKNLSDAESYILVFSDNKLVKIIAATKNIEGDIYGREGKERFDNLKKTLTKKYGPPSVNYQSSGNKLYNENDEFYQCLAYKGCGTWASCFTTPTKDICLDLKGIRRGTGFIQVTAESIPEWGKALEQYKKLKSKSDSDSL